MSTCAFPGCEDYPFKLTGDIDQFLCLKHADLWKKTNKKHETKAIQTKHGSRLGFCVICKNCGNEIYSVDLSNSIYANRVGSVPKTTDIINDKIKEGHLFCLRKRLFGAANKDELREAFVRKNPNVKPIKR